MKFKGDIIITDPCYIDTVDDKLWEEEIVDIYTGMNLEKYGFTNYIWEDTIYGDWSCNTRNTNTGEIMGTFGADSGLVGVFYISEVMSFNPKFDIDKFISNGLCTKILGFDGDIEYSEGHGTAYITGIGNINFRTSQWE